LLQAIKLVVSLVTPKCWRPPFGDVDARIRAIATALNLTTVVWQYDSNDWQVGTRRAWEHRHLPAGRLELPEPHHQRGEWHINIQHRRRDHAHARADQLHYAIGDQLVPKAQSCVQEHRPRWRWYELDTALRRDRLLPPGR
ncbi:hypothetical protein FIBSPDRAFT_780350, partial [Athelia psychrophila]